MKAPLSKKETIYRDQRHFKYTTLQKKPNTWFRSPNDPNLGSMTPRGQKVINRGSFPETAPFNNFLPLWDRWPIGVMGAPETSVAFLLEGSVTNVHKLSFFFFFFFPFFLFTFLFSFLSFPFPFFLLFCFPFFLSASSDINKESGLNLTPSHQLPYKLSIFAWIYRNFWATDMSVKCH